MVRRSQRACKEEMDLDLGAIDRSSFLAYEEEANTDTMWDICILHEDQEYHIPISSSDTIAALKLTLHRKLEIPIGNITLRYHEKALLDPFSLSDVPLANGARLELATA